MSLPSFVSYLLLEKNYSSHTVKAYERDILAFSTFCRDVNGIDSIDKVNYGIIRNWVVTLVDSKISNRSINRKIASLKAYFKFLQRIGTILENPLASHKALKTPKKVEIPFSVEEMEIVLSRIPFGNNFEGVRDKLIIDLLYATGIRRSELINLKMDGINFSDKSMKVLGKRNKERIIPLMASTLASFTAYFDRRKELPEIFDHEFVFLVKSGHKIYETLVYRIINGYFSKVSSKVKKSPHVLTTYLRDTFAEYGCGSEFRERNCLGIQV